MAREQLLLFVEQDGDDDADDEDHGQDGPDDPDEPLLPIDDGLGVRVVQLDGVREGTGSIGLQDRDQSTAQGWDGHWRVGKHTKLHRRSCWGGCELSAAQPKWERGNALFSLQKMPCS